MFGHRPILHAARGRPSLGSNLLFRFFPIGSARILADEHRVARTLASSSVQDRPASTVAHIPFDADVRT